MIDTERRKRVMSRSLKLGRCVCDAKQPCPCELFKAKNICQCAGERLEEPEGEVRLTQLVEKAGCASKIDQAFLKEVLAGLPMPQDARVLVGVPAGDDAGVYDLGAGGCLVQTVDVFTPTVDDPYVFGQIAAANSVSDIYAMGGVPLTALSVIGFPVRKLPDRVMREILRGGIDKMQEAGVSIIGGHSINDDQIKAGFAVTGLIDKDRVVSNGAAKPGDVLVLTKPLGTGIISFAGQIGKAAPEHLAAAGASMATLNKAAAEIMLELGAHAATDITGFGLMGHLSEMARRSGVDVELVWEKLPWLPGAVEYATAGILPGAIERNKESCAHAAVCGPDVTELMADMCYDAQTSGGLLIAIAGDKANRLLERLYAAGLTASAVIGQVRSTGQGKVFITTHGGGVPLAADATVAALPDKTGAMPPMTANKPAETACCAAVNSAAQGTYRPADSLEDRYSQFLAGVARPGALDAVTKQAINIALSVALRCEPCLKAHIAKARQKGFSDAEIDEAAWMGVAFGGSPAMMLYNEVKSKIKM